MNPTAPLDLLAMAADRLGDLADEVVFVGGAVVGMLLSGPAVRVKRFTEDVDAVAELAGISDFHRLEKRLRERGWANVFEGPICRFRHGIVVLDVVPTDPDILGFSNPWYPAAIRSATRQRLRDDLSISVLSPVVFLATKWSAFDSPHRENGGDHFCSRDLEDILTVIDGRPEIVQEATIAETEVRDYLRERFGRFMDHRDWPDCLEAHVEKRQVDLVADRVRRIAEP